MENQQTEIRFDNRRRGRRTPIEHIDGGDEGVYLLDLDHAGCRHVHGGQGLGLKLCGKPGKMTGLTYLCSSHLKSYSREKVERR